MADDDNAQVGQELWEATHPSGMDMVGVPGERGTTALDEGHEYRTGLDIEKADVPVGAEKYDTDKIEIMGFTPRYKRAFQAPNVPNEQKLLDQAHDRLAQSY